MLAGAVPLRNLRPAAEPARAERGLQPLPDQRAFVLDHHRFVTRVLWAQGTPRSAVDDAAQQVFLVALRQLGEIRDARAFLFGVAVRVAREQQRIARRHGPAAEPDDGDRRRSEDPHPDQLLDMKRARVMLDGVLETLPEDIRAAFVLYEIEELTLREIASALGVPQGTVASRVRRGRELFRQAAQRVRARIEQEKGR
jgi:RNA polymerase sigma-70 factor, ECF subfamily